MPCPSNRLPRSERVMKLAGRRSPEPRAQVRILLGAQLDRIFRSYRRITLSATAPVALELGIASPPRAHAGPPSPARSRRLALQTQPWETCPRPSRIADPGMVARALRTANRYACLEPPQVIALHGAKQTDQVASTPASDPAKCPRGHLPREEGPQRARSCCACPWWSSRRAQYSAAVAQRVSNGLGSSDTSRLLRTTSASAAVSRAPHPTE
jgi:hypothetical protein